MIPVQGYDGQKVAVLGLGRSGLATAAALQAGGAIPVCWDDSPEGRARAEAEGYQITDLTRAGAFEDIAALITSPGIPHLYPAPNAVIAAAMRAGVSAPVVRINSWASGWMKAIIVSTGRPWTVSVSTSARLQPIRTAAS